MCNGRSCFGLGVTLHWLVLSASMFWANHVRSEGLEAGQSLSAPHQISATSQVGVRSDYSERRDTATRRAALVVKTSVNATSTESSFSPSVLIESRLFDDGQHTLIAAGMLSYRNANWTAVAGPFYQWTVHATDGRWQYWGNVRRQLGLRHSLGVELYGSIETHEPTKWLLVYSGGISKPLSVSVAVGAGFDAGPDLAIRTTAMWRLGAARGGHLERGRRAEEPRPQAETPSAEGFGTAMVQEIPPRRDSSCEPANC